jgi:TDG/mug DNA glycosylase family protein
MHTLDDSLAAGLDVIFVGINPSLYSVERGHYFARRANKFWPSLSRSRLSLRARIGLGVDVLTAEHDRELARYGIGFTDLVKRPTAKASELGARELAAGVDALVEKLRRYAPRIACFHGITGYRHVGRALGDPAATIALGLQALRLGDTRVFLVPNPSGANAHYTRDDQVRWYDALANALEQRARRPRRTQRA